MTPEEIDEHPNEKKKRALDDVMEILSHVPKEERLGVIRGAALMCGIIDLPRPTIGDGK